MYREGSWLLLGYIGGIDAIIREAFSFIWVILQESHPAAWQAKDGFCTCNLASKGWLLRLQLIHADTDSAPSFSRLYDN